MTKMGQVKIEARLIERIIIIIQKRFKFTKAVKEMLSFNVVLQSKNLNSTKM